MSHAKKLGLRFKAIPRGMLGIASTRLCPSLRVRHFLLLCPVGVGVCVRKPQRSCCHFGSLAASLRQSLDEVGEDLLSKTGGGTPLASYWEPRSLQINPSKDTPPKGYVSNSGSWTSNIIVPLVSQEKKIRAAPFFNHPKLSSWHAPKPMVPGTSPVQ